MNKRKKKKDIQDEFDEMLKEAMKNPGVATVMEIIESLKTEMDRLKELENMTRPIIITTTSSGTA